MTDHRKTLVRVSETYRRRGFKVQVKGNNLPAESGRLGAIYQPDTLVRKGADGQIVWIVEIETSDAGKAVAGAAVLADVCMQVDMDGGR
jgi:hypothetical protein